MSFLIPLARAAATVGGRGRLAAFSLGKAAGDKSEAQQSKTPDTSGADAVKSTALL